MFSAPQAQQTTAQPALKPGTKPPVPAGSSNQVYRDFGGMPMVGQNPGDLYKDAIIPGLRRNLALLQSGQGFMPIDMTALPDINSTYQQGLDRQLNMAGQNMSGQIGNQSIRQLGALTANNGMAQGTQGSLNTINDVASGQNRITTGNRYEGLSQNPLTAQQQAALGTFGGIANTGTNQQMRQAGDVFNQGAKGRMDVKTNEFNPFLNGQMNSQQAAAMGGLGNLGYASTSGWSNLANNPLNAQQNAAQQQLGNVGSVGSQGWQNLANNPANQQQNAALRDLNNVGTVGTQGWNDYLGQTGGNAQQQQAGGLLSNQATGGLDVGTGRFNELYNQSGQPSYSEANLRSMATADPTQNPYLDQLESLINDQIASQAKASASAAGRGYGSGYESGQVADAITRNVLQGRLAQYNTDADRKIQANTALDTQRMAGLNFGRGVAGDIASLGASNADRQASGTNALAQLGAQLSGQQLSGLQGLNAAQSANMQRDLNVAQQRAGIGSQLAGQQIAGLQGVSAAQNSNINRDLNVAQQLGALGGAAANQQIAGLSGLNSAQSTNINRGLNVAQQQAAMGNQLAGNQLTAAQNVANIQSGNYGRQLDAAGQQQAAGQQSIANRLGAAGQQAAIGAQGRQQQMDALGQLTNVQGANIANQVNAAGANVQARQQGVQDMMRAQALLPELNNARYADAQRIQDIGQTLQNRQDQNWSQQRMDAIQAQQAPFEQLNAYMQLLNGGAIGNTMNYDLGAAQFAAQQPSGLASTLGTIGMVGGLANQAGLLQPFMSGAGNALSSVGGSILGGLF